MFIITNPILQLEKLEQRRWALPEARIPAEWKCRRWHPGFPLTTLPSCTGEEGTLLMPWLGHWVGLIGEHLPNCSCLCRLYFIALLHFHHSVSMGYFVSSGILSLLLCGFLTSSCFKIPCRTPRKNVRPGGWHRHQQCTPARPDCCPLGTLSIV